MNAEQIFKKVSSKTELRDIPITHISRVTYAVLETLLDEGCVMRNDYV